MVRKREMIERLHMLEQQEVEYLSMRKATERSVHHEAPERSEFTEDDKRMLMRLRLRMVRFEEHIGSKNRSLEYANQQMAKQREEEATK
jgi:hypothetical protein